MSNSGTTYANWVTKAEVWSEGEVGARWEQHNKGNCFSLEQPPMQEFQEARAHVGLYTCLLMRYAQRYCSVNRIS